MYSMPTSVNKCSDDVTSKSPRVGDGNDSGTALRDEYSGPVEGNMCASSTGVVRFQSRRKAEMFLVRTDGFSCTREKVTESSLAFTHPSTQQQMLMWKSVPKTVLLLKKMGEELMEDSKQVIVFEIYARAKVSAENMSFLYFRDLQASEFRNLMFRNSMFAKGLVVDMLGIYEDMIVQVMLIYLKGKKKNR